MTRISRAEEARSVSTRKPIGGAYTGRLHIDPAIIPKDMDVRWVREVSRGERDDENLARQFDERGFLPATTDDFPSLAPRRIPGMPVSEDNLIRRGGLLLVKRPKQDAIDERAELDALTMQNTKSVARVSTSDVSGAQMDGTNFRDASSMTIHKPEVGSRAGKFAE